MEKVEGINPVIEALKSDRTIEKIYLLTGRDDMAIAKILRMCRDKKVVVSYLDRKKLDDMSETKVHQGVIALISDLEYKTIDDILNLAYEKNEAPFIVILDSIEDPYNLGSIIRTANICGVHGVIMPKRRICPITATVEKASSGAISSTFIARVNNLDNTIRELKEKGLWIYAAEADAKSSIFETDFKGPVALVIGSEGKGISRLVKESCDFLVSIPQFGSINSLNASVAAGILLYEVVRKRM